MVFSDLFYPDNSKREKRAVELAADITNSISDLHKNKIGIDKALKDANEIIKKEFKRFSIIPKEKEYELGDQWVASAVDIIASTIVFAGAKYGLQRASLAYLVRTNSIGPLVFLQRVGLPTWFKVGSLAGAVLAALAISAIIGSIFGAVRRKKLREAIKDLIPARVKFMEAQMVTNEILIPLLTIIGIVKAVEGSLTQEELEKLIKDFVKEQNKRLVDLVKEVVPELKAIDNSRGSWTNED